MVSDIHSVNFATPSQHHNKQSGRLRSRSERLRRLFAPKKGNQDKVCLLITRLGSIALLPHVELTSIIAIKSTAPTSESETHE
jgi:hypothetical protein